HAAGACGVDDATEPADEAVETLDPRCRDDMPLRGWLCAHKPAAHACATQNTLPSGNIGYFIQSTRESGARQRLADLRHRLARLSQPDVKQRKQSLEEIAQWQL